MWFLGMSGLLPHQILRLLFIEALGLFCPSCSKAEVSYGQCIVMSLVCLIVRQTHTHASTDQTLCSFCHEESLTCSAVQLSDILERRGTER